LPFLSVFACHFWPPCRDGGHENLRRHRGVLVIDTLLDAAGLREQYASAAMRQRSTRPALPAEFSGKHINPPHATGSL
jgi:hypothetical protein